MSKNSINNIKKLLKKNTILIISFLLPIIILSLALIIVLKVYPFGNRTILVSDLFEQYNNFYNYLRDTILAGENIFYSFSFGLGQNMTALISYFCLSPLNLLFLFSNTNNIYIFTLIIIVLKIGLSGLTMASYLKNKFSNKFVILFATMYALISYNICYGTNLMWLDAVYLLPLIIGSLEDLITKNRVRKYIVTLTVCIFSNFYIAFPLCIFLFLYFIYYCLLQNYKFKEIIKKLKKFILISILPVLLNMFMLLPTFLNLLSGKLETAELTTKLTNYNFLNIFNKFFIGNISNTIIEDLPHVYCSILAITLLLLAACNKKLTKRYKILSFSFIAFLLLCTFVSPLDTIMHGFRVPNLFYCRYAFLIPFLIIIVAFSSFNNSDYNYKNMLMYILFIALIAINICTSTNKFNLIISITLMVGYILMGIFLKNKNYLFLFFLLFLTIEELINITYPLKTYTFVDVDRYNYLTTLKEELEPYKLENNEFYRMDTVSFVTYDDNFTTGIYGFTTFSPTVSSNITTFLKNRLGYQDNRSYPFEIINGTVFTNSLVGLKYIYNYNMYGDQKIEASENEYVLPIIFKTKKNNVISFENNYIANQDLIYQYFMDETLFEKEENYEIEGCGKMGTTLKRDKAYCLLRIPDADPNYYYYFDFKSKQEIVVKVPGYRYLDYYYTDAEIIASNNSQFSFRENEVTLEYFNVYKVSKIKLKNLHDLAFAHEFKIENVTKNTIKGNISSESSGLLYTSIPYDSGWHVYINGEEVKTTKIFDALLAIEIPEGELEINFIYYPPGLLAGIIISFATISIIIVYRQRKALKKDI